MKNNHKGFGIVEGLLILVILGIIGFTGWYVLHSKDSANSTYSNVADTINTKQTTNTQSSTTDVIKISELGIEFTIPTTLKDLSYKVINVDYSSPGNNDLGTYPTAYLSTKALNTTEGGKCDITSASVTKGTVPPLGFLTKTTGQYPTAPTADNSTGTLVKQFSTYYIAYRSAGMSCFSETSNIDTVTTLNGQLAVALKSIAEIK